MSFLFICIALSWPRLPANDELLSGRSLSQTTSSITSLFDEEIGADRIQSDKGSSGLGRTIAFLKYILQQHMYSFLLTLPSLMTPTVDYRAHLHITKRQFNFEQEKFCDFQQNRRNQGNV